MPRYPASPTRVDTFTRRNNAVAGAAPAPPGPTAPPVAGYQIWLPSDGLKWQDVAGVVAASADGDPVARWDDYSGNGLHALQAVAGFRSLLKKAIVNSRDVLRFDGVDDVSLVAMTASATRTIFVVLKSVAPIAGYKTPWALADAAQIFTNSVTGTGYNYFVNEAVGAVVGTGDPSAWNIMALTYSSVSAANLRVGGGAGTPFDPQDSYSSSIVMSLGANLTPAQHVSMDTAEVISYPTALSLANINLVGAALATKFAVPWTPAV